MPLEIPREVPRPADSGARKKSGILVHGQDQFQKLRFEFAELQAQRAQMKRNADWERVIRGDADPTVEEEDALAWLRDTYPALEADYVRRFVEQNYVPWADETGQLHFYVPHPEASYDQMDASAFKRMIDSWVVIERIANHRIQVLLERQKALMQEAGQRVAVVSEDSDLFTSEEHARVRTIHQQEIEKIRQDIGDALKRLQYKRDQMREWIAEALPFAEQHGFVDVAGLTEDTSRLIPVPSKSGPREISKKVA